MLIESESDSVDDELRASSDTESNSERARPGVVSQLRGE